MDLKEMQKAIAARLTDAEVATLENAIAARKALGQSVNKSESIAVRLAPDELLVLEAIVSFMDSTGVDASNAGMLAKTSNFQAFKKKVPAIMQVLKASNLKRNETRAVLRTGASMLYQVLTEQGVEATSRRMMDHIHRLPAQLDRHFPGYAMMGLLSVIVRARAENTNED